MKKFFFDRRKEEENWKRERAIFLLFPTIFVPNTEQEAEKESVSLERRRNGRVGRAADSSSRCWKKRKGEVGRWRDDADQFLGLENRFRMFSDGFYPLRNGNESIGTILNPTRFFNYTEEIYISYSNTIIQSSNF